MLGFGDLPTRAEQLSSLENIILVSYNEDGHAKKPSDAQNSQVVVSTQPPLNLFLNKIIFVHMGHNMIIY
jgi:hypothetical protein